MFSHISIRKVCTTLYVIAPIICWNHRRFERVSQINNKKQYISSTYVAYNSKAGGWLAWLVCMSQNLYIGQCHAAKCKCDAHTQRELN